MEQVVGLRIGISPPNDFVVVGLTDYTGQATLKDMGDITLFPKKQLSDFNSLDVYNSGWQDLAVKLFDICFPPTSKIREHIDTIMTTAKEGHATRLNLTVDENLAYIPWELMYCDGDPLFRHPHTSIIRTINLAKRRTNSRDNKRVILFVVADSDGGLSEYHSEIINTINGSGLGKRISVIPVVGPDTLHEFDNSIQDLERREEGAACIVGIHMVAHGQFDDDKGYHLLFPDNSLHPRRMNSVDLYALLNKIRLPCLRFLFLQSCLTANINKFEMGCLASSLAQKCNIPWVIGMKGRPDRNDCRQFFTRLYAELGRQIERNEFTLSECLLKARYTTDISAVPPVPIVYYSPSSENLVRDALLCGTHSQTPTLVGVKRPALGYIVEQVRDLLLSVGDISDNEKRNNITIFKAVIKVDNRGKTIVVCCSHRYDDATFDDFQSYLDDQNIIDGCECFFISAVKPPYFENPINYITICEYSYLYNSLLGLNEYINKLASDVTS